MTTSPQLRRRTLATLFAAGALLLTGCSATPSDPAEPPRTEAGSVLDQYGLTGMGAREVIERLDTMAVAERPATLLASVQPDELVLTDTANGATETLLMPDGEFYLSVAPYQDQTHGCTFHSLTTCLGEMAGKTLDLTVTDDAGQLVLDETRTTYDNGFVGLWLPRDLSGTLTLEHNGKTATAPIATGADDLTCLTTTQLT